jgi:hypothetical protein
MATPAQDGRRRASKTYTTPWDITGFEAPHIETLAARSRAATAQEPAIAYCQGTPWRSEIEARGTVGLAEVTSVCADAIQQRFGAGPVDGKIQAHVVWAYR